MFEHRPKSERGFEEDEAVPDTFGASEGDKATASRATNVPRFVRPIWLCGLSMAFGAAAAAIAWWALHDGNHAPMRWSRLIAEPPSKLYDELVRAPAAPGPGQKSISCPDARICRTGAA